MEKILNFSNTLLPSPTGSLDTYISHIMSIPPLTTEEEVALGRNLQSTNDLESAKKLIMHNLRYVIYIAKSYSGYGLNLNDLSLSTTIINSGSGLISFEAISV